MVQPGSPEGEGGLSRVAERSLERAAEHGRVAERDAWGFLDKYVENETISHEEAEIIAGTEREDAARKYLEERIAGRHNDKCSTQPGITAIVTEPLKLRGEEVLGTPETDSFAPLAPTFEDVEATSNAGPLYRMRLEHGWYESNSVAVQFFAEASMAGPDGRVIGGGDKFAANPYEVVRVESDAGEYWQSPMFNTDGSYTEN